MTISAIGSSAGYDVTRQANAIFKRLDTNGDGGIDKSELKAGLSQGTSADQTAVDTDQLFAEVDTNGDGKIDASENEAQAKKMSAKGGASSAGGAAPAGGGAKTASAASSTSTDSSKIYDEKDLNEDGTVSYQEEIEYDLKHPGEQYNAQGELEKLPSTTQSQVNTAA